MEFVIITGISGAGKSTALNFFEDMGYYCINNIPPALMVKFAELCDGTGDITKIAFGIDIRGGKLFEDFLKELREFRRINQNCKIVFIDCNDNKLVKRYKETRREHPLSKGDRILKGIERERLTLEPIKYNADYIIDTSFLLTRELKERLQNLFVEDKKEKKISVSILSFGFKFGIPNDVDLVFDVRFIYNPYYVAELREKTGQDKEVQDFVMKHEVAQEFFDKLYDMIKFLLPNYAIEGKNSLVIGIGCTGGKHRSVTLANKLYEKLKEDNYYVQINHNDIDKR